MVIVNRKTRIVESVVIFSSLLLLSGCISHEVNEAAAFAARLVQSSKYEVDASEQASERIYDLHIMNAKYDSSFSQNEILSTCALAFFNQLPNHDEAAYVRLTIENEANSYQQTYSANELRSIDRCIENVSTFFRWHPSMGVDSIRPILEERFFPDIALEQMGAVVLYQDSLDNSFQRCEFHGFEMDTVAEIPVIILKVDALRKQSKNSYNAFLSIQSEKILWLLQTDL